MNHDTGCSWGNLVHEFMHKLGMNLRQFIYFLTIIDYYIVTFTTKLIHLLFVSGFFHEQTRPDRDKFITISWDNLAAYEQSRGVSAGRWSSQFKACSGRGCKVSTANYDYGSIMHYSPYMGNYKVMEAKSTCPNPPCKIKYQRSRLSKLDIQGINKVYGCNGKYKLCTKLAFQDLVI